MPLSTLKARTALEGNPKLVKAEQNLNSLLAAIGQKSISPEVEKKINEIIEEGNNNFGTDDKERIKRLKTAQTAILKILEKDHQIVPKNHYQLQWTAIGMAAIGLPLGMAFGMSLGNLGLMGLGLPIGLGVGVAIGTAKDKQTAQEGRQLDWSAK